MATTDSTACVAHLDRADMKCMDDGSFHLPLLLDSENQQVHAHLELSRDDAARLHAQLERRLNQGWALTEEAMAAKQTGDYTL